jgi:hypothetical protein
LSKEEGDYLHVEVVPLGSCVLFIRLPAA